jgi:hypothetical protein
VPVQQFDGDGTLRESNGTEAAVHYSITVRTTTVRRGGGLPPVPGRSEGRGRISTTDGRHFAEGVYHLTTAQGDRMRLQKLGGDWYVLASVP